MVFVRRYLFTGRRLYLFAQRARAGRRAGSKVFQAHPDKNRNIRCLVLLVSDMRAYLLAVFAILLPVFRAARTVVQYRWPDPLARKTADSRRIFPAYPGGGARKSTRLNSSH